MATTRQQYDDPAADGMAAARAENAERDANNRQSRANEYRKIERQIVAMLAEMTEALEISANEARRRGFGIDDIEALEGFLDAISIAHEEVVG